MSKSIDYFYEQAYEQAKPDTEEQPKRNVWEEMAESYEACLKSLEQRQTESAKDVGGNACATLVEVSILTGDPISAGIATAVEYLPSGEREQSDGKHGFQGEMIIPKNQTGSLKAA